MTSRNATPSSVFAYNKVSDLKGAYTMSCLDGNLLSKAREGDRESIRALCEYLAICHKAGTFPDAAATSFLYEVLDKIRDGLAPDAAFGWKQNRKGRRKQNSVFLHWTIKLSGQQMMASGESWRAACLAVSSHGNSEFPLSEKAIEQVCAGLTLDTNLDIPDDIYPLPEAVTKRTRKD